MKGFHKLSAVSISDITHILQPNESEEIDLNSSAMLVFTDFKHQLPFMLEQSTPVDEAIVIMHREHVRRKLVIDHEEHFRGIVSMADLVSTKTVKTMQELGLRHDEMTVEHIMTPKAKLHAIELRILEASKIGDVLETMQAFGEEHLLIVDDTANLRGIVSSTDIARAIHLPVSVEERRSSYPGIIAV